VTSRVVWMRPARPNDEDQPNGPLKRPLRWFVVRLKRLLDNLGNLSELLSQFVTLEAVTTSVIIVVVLPLLVWWIV
jgi:hypothetical protein